MYRKDKVVSNFPEKQDGMKIAGFLGSPKVRNARVKDEFSDGWDAFVLGWTSFVKYFVSPAMVRCEFGVREIQKSRGSGYPYRDIGHKP